MKRVINQSNNYQGYCWTYIVLIIFTICLISFNASFAQTNHHGGEKTLVINGKKIKHKKRDKSLSESNCNRLPNRTIDGTCNNISDETTMHWGATDIPLFREMYAGYGAPDFYNDMSGNCRISPRAISNLVVAQSADMPSPRNLSSLVFTWGQFLDHDIDLTPEGETEYVPILLPANEPLFSSPIPFLRSEPYEGSGVTSPRQQENIITAWIDASQVYGSESSRADWLRTFSNGKLKTSAGNLLPYNTLNGSLEAAIDPNAPSMAGDDGGISKVFVAGDVRANEQPGLTAMHTLFVREHNRICDQLIGQGMNNDEQIYQRARKRVGAYMQAITYNHFLPALGINVRPYVDYNANVKADISNMFATAAYRLGHTMVTNEIPIVDNDCEAVGSGSIELLEGFFNPTVVATYGIEAILQGLAGQTQQKVDAKIVDNLRNFLFPVPGSDEAFGLDLASLNIQRGRDHGLPDYNTVRAHFTGQGANEFSDITSDTQLQLALEKAYGNVYDIDLWVGLLSEDPLNDSSVGQTLDAILAYQFEKLRDGDFYFYRNDPAFSNQQRNQINNTTLADIMLRNGSIQNLQNNPFFAANCNLPPNDGGDRPGGGGNDGPGDGRPGGGGGPRINAINNLDVYPNPSSGKIQVQIQLEEAVDQLEITVQNLDGKVLYKEKAAVYDQLLSHELNLSKLTAGLYLVKVKSGKKVFSKKLVIQ